MSVSAISAGSLAVAQSIQPTSGDQNRLQRFRQDFQQIGEDLQAGNVAGAQAAFANIPKPGRGQTSTQPGAPVEQAFGQLGQNLQSGNVAAAEQDFAKIQQDVQNHFSQSASSVADTLTPSPASTLSISA